MNEFIVNKKKNCYKTSLGFTLIELLSVIVILSVILVVAVPKILDAINKSRLSTYNNQKDLVNKAAQLYTTTNVEVLPTVVGNTSFIKLSDLISNNYIKDVKDPMDKSTCSSSNSGVLVTKETDGYKYESYLQCANYKSDTTIPLISTTIVGNNLTVNSYDENGLLFDGTDDYGLINLTVPSIITIEAYGYANIIAAKMLWSFDGSSYGAGPDLYPECNYLNLNVGDGCANPFTNLTIYPTINEWHHYAVVFDQIANLGRLYIDGNFIGTAVYKNPAGTRLFIGKYDNTGYYWKGYIKEIRIWNTVRTATEISNNYNKSLQGNESGLIAYYKINEAKGTSLIDYSANNYNGTIYGATWKENSGIKEIRIKQGATLINSSNLSTETFTLVAGNYTIEVEDNVGNVTTKSITI